MKNRKLLLIVSIVLAMTMSLGGTLAYLTDTDGDVNTMVLGNVKITQNEQQRVEANGEFTSQLEAFEQYKMMLPVTYPGNRTEDSVTVGEYTVPLSDTEANYIDKIVSVTNDGNTDAYVRTLVAIPTGGEAWEPTAVSANDCWLHWNYPNTQEWKDSWTLNGTYTFAEINGKGYYVWEFVHKGAVEAGKTTYPVIKGFYLDQRVDTNDEGYYYVKYDNGNIRVVDDFTPGETVDILVLSQAVQAGGFTDAQTALDTGFGDVTKENAEAWFGGLRKVQYVEAGGEKDQIAGEDAAEILESLTAGNDLFVDEDVDLLGFDANNVDANGATVTLNGVGPDAYGYLAFLPEAGENVEVSNLNVTGSGFVEIGHWEIGGGEYTAENLKIEGLASTLANNDKGFTLGCAFMAYGDLTLNNCVMTGTTAVQDGVLAVDLGCGQAWSGYSDDNDNQISTTVNGGEYGTIYCWSHSVVEINGAEVATMYVSPIKGSVTIKEGTHIGTLNVDYGTSAGNVTKARLEKLVIEDGAAVDAIVYGGTTYTVEEWSSFVANFN